MDIQYLKVYPQESFDGPNFKRLTYDWSIGQDRVMHPYLSYLCVTLYLVRKNGANPPTVINSNESVNMVGLSSYPIGSLFRSMSYSLGDRVIAQTDHFRQDMTVLNSIRENTPASSSNYGYIKTSRREAKPLFTPTDIHVRGTDRVNLLRKSAEHNVWGQGLYDARTAPDPFLSLFTFSDQLPLVSWRRPDFVVYGSSRHNMTFHAASQWYTNILFAQEGGNVSPSWEGGPDQNDGVQVGLRSCVLYIATLANMLKEIPKSISTRDMQTYLLEMDTRNIARVLHLTGDSDTMLLSWHYTTPNVFQDDGTLIPLKLGFELEPLNLKLQLGNRLLNGNILDLNHHSNDNDMSRLYIQYVNFVSRNRQPLMSYDEWQLNPLIVMHYKPSGSKDQEMLQVQMSWNVAPTPGIVMCIQTLHNKEITYDRSPQGFIEDVSVE
jgi:hypothetical protein